MMKHMTILDVQAELLALLDSADGDSDFALANGWLAA